jgi:hypothetical protein
LRRTHSDAIQNEPPFRQGAYHDEDQDRRNVLKDEYRCRGERDGASFLMTFRNEAPNNRR